ncbi:hypothetical protein [Ochrobactrum sp. J50]|uniref:hypothetical protein n=1 Tax=Ochrobactrum sp. J50 TaxID=936132 RepID=UPI0011A41169|nr:hypothetical protein [Ochrobactrum sp. J50]
MKNPAGAGRSDAIEKVHYLLAKLHWDGSILQQMPVDVSHISYTKTPDFSFADDGLADQIFV